MKLSEKEKEADDLKRQFEDFIVKHEETKKELQKLIVSRQEQFENYMKEILEVRQKALVTTPSLFYGNKEDPTLKEHQKYLQHQEAEIKRKLRNQYKVLAE